MQFRSEVTEHQRAQRLGEPLLITPLSFKVLTALVAAVVIAIGCFLYWGTYTTKQTVAGYILPSKGVVTVYAPQFGTIVERYVHLGERVRKGQKLYEIALQRSTLNTSNVNAALLKQYDAQLQSIEVQRKQAEQLGTAKVTQLLGQQRDFRSEYKNLGGEFQTEKAILKLAEDNLARYQSLARTGMVSKSGLQKIQQQVMTQKSQVEQIDSKMAALIAQLNQIPAEISETKSNTASDVANLKAQAAQIKLQRLELQVAQKVIVRSPSSGVISSVIARVGQNVNTQASGLTSQSALLSILPQGSVLEARLLVPTRSIGFVHPGERVRFRYSAFPYQRFGLYRGKVRGVSRSVITPGELDLPVNLNGPYYLVTASLVHPYVHAYGRRLPLTAGMTLSADIVLNRERLYNWLLRPLESLRGNS